MSSNELPMPFSSVIGDELVSFLKCQPAAVLSGTLRSSTLVEKSEAISRSMRP
jgi:hypothetical protein